MGGAVFIALILVACVTTAPVSAQGQATAPTAMGGPPSHPMFAQGGYLTPSDFPDLTPLLDPPPVADSAGQARDEAARDAALRLAGTPRYALARSDADMRVSNPLSVFSCAANAEISPETTPRTSALLIRAGADFGRSVGAMKAQYRRARPFAQHNATSCTPADEQDLRNNGSYPSGHGVVGWGWALILVELIPDRANEILQRGREYGQSRLVCDVHWQSDVESGRIASSALFARLHADPTFRSDLDAARKELATSRPPAPAANTCRAEAAALTSVLSHK